MGHPHQYMLFSPNLIGQHHQEGLPPMCQVRPLETNDYDNGHLKVLAHLTSAPDIGQTAWTKRYDEFKMINDIRPTYFTVVIGEGMYAERVIACATLVIERKFLRNAGMVGHIEDVVVDPKYQGKKLGLKLIEVLTELSEDQGCYKTILDCDPKNEGFYKKCGYENKGCEMAKYA